jgi:phosphoglycerate dehydrogenase-like enzyme
VSANTILVAFHIFKDRDAPWLEPLRARGFRLVHNELGRTMTEAELIAALPGVVATIAAAEPYNERVFAAAPELRVVARYGVGYDMVDVAAATRAGVPVAMAFGTNHETVADYAVGMALALGIRLLPHHRLVAGGGWGGAFQPGFWGRTIGIVGLGRIGRAVARRCAAFGMRILGTDPLADTAYALAHRIELVPLDRLLAESDIVTIHCPRLPSTTGLIGRAELARMKKGAVLVNTARGGIIDEAALVEALDSGQLAGAGLDVFAVEPPVGSPLLARDDVILAPHVAGTDLLSERLMGERCVENILAILDGRDPGPGLVLNPEALGRGRTGV